MSKPKYIGQWVCADCKTYLSEYEKMHSNGVCPHCGLITQGTICATVKYAVPVGEAKKPWWRVWP